MVRRSLLVGSLLLLLPAAAVAAEPPARITWQPEAPRQGDPLLLEVRPKTPADRVTGTFLGHTLVFEPWGEGVFRALAPISVKVAPGAHRLEVVLHRGRRVRRDRRQVTVAGAEFPESRLSVNPRFTRPPKKARARIRRDRRHIRAAWRRGRSGRLWRGAFRRPIDSEKTGEFGTQRTFNGKVRSRHLGLDLDADVGDPVHAAGRGRVVLAEDLYYSGNSVFVDHGDGLFTVYFHLSELVVAPGDAVEAGDLLGKAGRTGRVTGPHLHFGVKLDGTYVSPETLLALDFGPDPALAPEATAAAEAGGADEGLTAPR